MKNKLFYCFLLVLCIIFTSCSKKDLTTLENTASALHDEQPAASADLQTTASADESVPADAEAINFAKELDTEKFKAVYEKSYK